MKKQFKRGLVAVIFMLFMMSLTVMASNVTIEVTYDQTSARSMLKMVNDFRKSSDAWAYDSTNTKVQYTDLNDLTYDYELEKAAMQRAAEIAIFFSHTRPDGSGCETAGGWGTSSNVYGYACGENIAAGQPTAQEAFVDWREDDYDYYGQGHRRNMLGADGLFTSIGIGHVIYNGRHFWVQEFGNGSHPVQTAANNKKTQMTITVNDSYIRKSGLSFTDPVNSLDVMYNSTKQIPDVTAYINLYKSEYDKSWPKPGDCPVVADITWTTADSSVASVSGNTITGKGVGSTTVSTSFLGKKLSLSVAVKRDISKAVVKAADAVYSGKAQKPVPTVTLDGTSLKAGTDFTAAYSSNTNAGTAKITITGKGNYSGSAQGTFRINPADLSKAVSVKGIAAQYYTGGIVKPGYTLTQLDKNLPAPAAGKDYNVSYQNANNVGVAVLTLTGKGNFAGTVQAQYKIIYRPLNSQFTYKKAVYRITKEGPSGVAEVLFVKPSGKKISGFSIPKTVTYGGVSYKVTAIGAKAFKGCSLLKKVTIGQNVTTIGSQAFYKCKKLRTVTISSKNLKKSSFGKNAFKGTNKKIRFNVPSAKSRNYIKWIRKAGAPKTASYKKK